jgi:hypothetical protein
MRGIPRQGGFYYLERRNLGRVIEVLAQNMYAYKTNIKTDWDLQLGQLISKRIGIYNNYLPELITIWTGNVREPTWLGSIFSNKFWVV